MLLAPLMLTLLATNAPWLGKLTVDPQPSDATVLVDGQACPTPCVVDEPATGRHVITVQKPGYLTRVVEVDMGLNDRKFLHIDLAFDFDSPEARLANAKALRATGWAALGTGAAAVASAVLVHFLITTPRQNNLAAVQEGANSDLLTRVSISNASVELERSRITTVGLAVAGGAALAGAAALLVWGPNPNAPEASTSVEPLSVVPLVAPTVGGAQAGAMFAW